jgi:SAM-dependent methyltransferase
MAWALFLVAGLVSAGAQGLGLGSDRGSVLDKATTRTPDVIFVPTPQDAVDKMLELAQVKTNDVVYDLGCGDGRIVVTAAKKYGVKAIGIDIDPKRIAESRENVRTNNVGHLVTIKQADIFEQDLSPASVVTLYLLPSLNVKLIPQLQKLAPGARIISYQFDMHGVKPEQVYNGRFTVYKWVAPLKVGSDSGTANLSR